MKTLARKLADSKPATPTAGGKTGGLHIMQHHSQIEIRAARLYVSPRTRALTPDEAETRRIAYAIKSLDCPTGMLETAAKEIAAMLWQPCNLIPVPSHTGDTRANLRLCKLIAAKTQGAQVRDILHRTAPVESQCQRHRAARGPMPPSAHNIARKEGSWIDALPTYIVDNVTTSGNTMQACYEALHFGTGLVFADAAHQPRR